MSSEFVSKMQVRKILLRPINAHFRVKSSYMLFYNIMVCPKITNYKCVEQQLDGAPQKNLITQLLSQEKAGWVVHNSLLLFSFTDPLWLTMQLSISSKFAIGCAHTQDKWREPLGPWWVLQALMLFQGIGNQNHQAGRLYQLYDAPSPPRIFTLPLAMWVILLFLVFIALVAPAPALLLPHLSLHLGVSGGWDLPTHSVKLFGLRCSQLQVCPCLCFPAPSALT